MNETRPSELTFEQPLHLSKAFRDIATAGMTVEKTNRALAAARVVSVPALLNLFEGTARQLNEWQERWLRSLPWYRRWYWHARIRLVTFIRRSRRRWKAA